MVRFIGMAVLLERTELSSTDSHAFSLAARPTLNFLEGETSSGHRASMPVPSLVRTPVTQFHLPVLATKIQPQGLSVS